MAETPEIGSFQPNIIKLLLGMLTVVASVATAGSLYFSLGLGLTPCHLCWYQRILMYPLAVVFAGATWQRDWKVVMYTFPLSLLGWGIAAWHSYIQRVGTAGCTNRWVLSDYVHGGPVLHTQPFTYRIHTHPIAFHTPTSKHVKVRRAFVLAYSVSLLSVDTVSPSDD